MKTTIYKCDRCGAQSTDLSILKLEIIAIGVKNVNYDRYHPGYDLYDAILREKEMCLRCREELGIYNAKPKEVVPESYPSLEDMIREIIRDETRRD